MQVKIANVRKKIKLGKTISKLKNKTIRKLIHVRKK